MGKKRIRTNLSFGDVDLTSLHLERNFLEIFKMPKFFLISPRNKIERTTQEDHPVCSILYAYCKLPCGEQDWLASAACVHASERARRHQLISCSIIAT